MKCPQCSADVKKGLDSCDVCYYVLPKQGGDADAAEPIDCASCGTTNPPGATACTMCNLLFVRVADPPPTKEKEIEETPKEKREDDTPPADEAPKETEPVATDAPVDCPSCQYTNPSGAETCIMCNFVMSMTPTKMQAEEKAPSAPAIEDIAIDIKDEAPISKPEPEPAPGSPEEQKGIPPELQVPLGRFPQRIPFKAANPRGVAECPNCHAQNEAADAICSMCSFVLKHISPPPVEKKDTEEAPRTPIDEKDIVIEELKQKTPLPMPEAVAEPEPEPVPEPEPEPLPKPEPEPKPAPTLEIISALDATCGMDSGAVPAQTSPVKQKRARPFILIAEHDYTQREALSTFLSQQGAQWLADCADGEEALIQAQSLSVEIVLLDLELDGANKGLETYKKMRASPFLEKDLPILFMSSLSPEKAEAVLPANDPYVHIALKPLDEEALWQSINEMTDNAFIDG